MRPTFGMLLMALTFSASLGGCAIAEFDQWQAEVGGQCDKTAGDKPEVVNVWINDRPCSVPLHSTWHDRGIVKPRWTTGVQVGQCAANGREWDVFIVGVVDIMPYYPITPEYNEICDVRILARTKEGDAYHWHRSDYDIQAMAKFKDRGRFVMGSFLTRADKWSLTCEGTNIRMKEQDSDAEFSIDLAQGGL